MLRFGAHLTRNRGTLRGFFVLWVVVCLMTACDRKKAGGEAKESAAPDAATRADGSTKEEADADGADAATAAADAPPEEPAVPIDVPWQEPARPLDELKAEIATREVGTLSGEIFGEGRTVRHVIRTQCGAGSVLQVIYDDEGTLRVTPGMAVRFFGLRTGKPVAYSEGDFDITVDFDHDTPARLAGHLRITYEEQGNEKVYADVKVDGRPSTMLLPPKMEGKGRMPLFEQCFPNGYFRAVEEDGTEHHGLLHVTDVRDQGAPLARVLFGDRTGLRVFVVPPKANAAVKTEEPLKLSHARNPGTRPAAVLIEAFWVPELTSPQTARAGNIAEEQTVQVQEGTARFALQRSGGRWLLRMTLKDLTIPMLLDGPLRGKTFSVIEIEAVPTPPGVVATKLGPKPDWREDEEE